MIISSVALSVVPADSECAGACRVGVVPALPVDAVAQAAVKQSRAEQSDVLFPLGQAVPLQHTFDAYLTAHLSGFNTGFRTAWDRAEACNLFFPVAVRSSLAGWLSGFSARISAAGVVSGHVVPTQVQGVDLYTIRPSEYRLRQSELYTDFSSYIDLSDGPYIPGSAFVWGDYQLTKLPAEPMSSGVFASAHQKQGRSELVAMPWQIGVSRSYRPDLPYTVEPYVPEPGDIPAPNAAKVHIIMNSIRVRSLPGNQPLAVADIRIHADRSTFSWSIGFSALTQGTIDLLKPTADGPAQFAIEINGHTWVGFVDSVQGSESVSDDRYERRHSVKAYSLSQFMAAPYAPKRTKSIGSTSAVQAAIAELTGTGFSLNWNIALLPDWAMPNASFSYQEQSPIQVIKRLAEAAGGMVLPGMNANELTVLPKYKVLPWQLLTADMDRSIHESQMENLSFSEQPGRKINSVMVSGEREGVALIVNRHGTPGDKPGADIINPFLTALDANKSRGAQEIAASGRRVEYSFSTALPEGADTQPGLLLPGQTLAVVHDESSKDFRCYVDSLTITAPCRGSADVYQQVVLDRPIEWEAA